MFKVGKNFSDYKYAFVLLNTLGWLAYWFLYQLVIFSQLGYSSKLIINSTIAVFSGYLTSLIIRLFYKKINYTVLSDIKLWALIFTFSVIHGNVWFFIDLIIYTQTRSSYNELVEWLTLGIYTRQITFFTLVIFAWSSIYFILKIRNSWRLLEQGKISAELDAKNLQIQLLRYQLNPHFLFNSLNSIRALMLKDVRRSREMISELSEFLKYSLINKNNSQVPIKDEIEAVKHFCIIEKIRYKEKLNISFDIDEETKNQLIPSLILHPLVENAIKYGMETSKLPLEINIKTYISNSKLVITISNSGRWFKGNGIFQNEIKGTNTGLENVKKILKNVYSKDHDFKIISDNENVSVHIEIILNERS